MCVTTSVFTAWVTRAFTSVTVQTTPLSGAGACDLDLSAVSAAGKKVWKYVPSPGSS